MAKRTHNVTMAMRAIIGAIRAENDLSLSAEERSAVINQAMDVVEDSDVLTVGEITDEGIEIRMEAERILEDAGIDPAEFRRRNALGNVRRIAEQERPLLDDGQ